MTDPKIKREHNTERPPSIAPAKPRGAIATLFAATPAQQKRDDDTTRTRPKYTPRPLPLRVYQDAELQSSPAKIKTEPVDEGNVVAAAPASAKDREVQPQHNKLVEPRHASGRHGTQVLPAASWLSSRPVSAKQTSALTTTYPLHNILAKYSRPHSTRSWFNQYPLPAYTKPIERITNMDGFGFGGDEGLGGSHDMDFNGFGAYAGIPDEQQLVTMPTKVLHDLQKEAQRGVVHELFNLNSQLYTRLTNMDVRVSQLEQHNASAQILSSSTADVGVALGTTLSAEGLLGTNAINTTPAQDHAKPVTKISAKRPVAKAFSGEGTTMPGRTKYRKKLQLEIPDISATPTAGAGIPTPMASALQVPPSALVSSFPATPRTPYTPGRIGPPDSYKKTTTSINKRAIHNLNKSMPPHNVQLPMVPLTDTEVVVYFFNSLSRPVVSLRLYARGWGPASIVQCLNNHRDVHPPYLRNTASVKCTTAIKLGEKLYGPTWEAEYRAVFATAEDPKATDLIRADDKVTVDYEIRALGAALKQHPAEEEGGIFTECVKYCIEHDAPYALSNIHQLAIDLQNGDVPQHPASPDRDAQSEGDMTEDEASDPPSPLAERSGLLGHTGGTINFTAGNNQREKQEKKEA
ncbi:hypothetical protein E8E11_010580 [Didymella keratinophila]|nr:hypothetical protein E8E11_010580 [Didymella keratinophila]